VITVVGDVLVDRYLHGIACGENPEVPGSRKIHVTHQEQLLGGAGAVAAVLAGAGEQVVLGSVVGGDREGRWVIQACKDARIGEKIWLEDRRCTPLKIRTVIEGRVVGDRLDREDVLPISDWAWGELSTIPLGNTLVLQDYGKGVLDATSCFTLIHQAVKKGIPVLVDPARGVPWTNYRGATLIKANHHEAAQELARVAGTGDGWNALSLAIALEDVHKTTIVVTCGAGGMAWATRDHWGCVDAMTTPVVDVTGAGDTVLAALAMFSDAPIADACEIAARAAEQQVGQLGVRPVQLPVRNPRDYLAPRSPVLSAGGQTESRC
jgi:D-beta-D-heptose 7-phosphate kinase/D-beta-D-heptose 1-phosphate adenosyltransferase